MEINKLNRNVASAVETARKARTAVRSLSHNTNLTSLNIRFSRRLEDISMLATLVNLRELEIEDCTLLKDLSPLSSLRNLEKLTIDSCEGLSDISCLEECRNIRSLRLMHCKNLYDLKVLTRLPRLESLSVCECGTLYSVKQGFVVDESGGNCSVYDKSSGASCSIHHIAGLVNLRHLELDGFRTMRNTNIFRDLMLLESLSLCDFKELSDLSGLSGLTNLSNLSILCNRDLTDVFCLADLPGLKKLSLHCCIALNDTGNITGLQDLSLSGLSLFENTAGLSRHRDLRSFSIEDCMRVKDLDVLAGLEHLTTLRIARCPVKSSKFLLKCPSLESVDTDLCIN